MSLMRFLLPCLLGLSMLAGCAAPPPDNARISDPLPTRDQLQRGQPDLGCQSDAECTVKNVGNCCGYYPACVNVDSPADPEAVKAQCAKEGRMSACGFPSITSCQCVAGQCKGSSAALLE